MHHQKHVLASSCTVHDEEPEICASIELYNTGGNIRNMYQYLVVQYTMKHRKYVSVSSCTLHDEASEICVSI